VAKAAVANGHSLGNCSWRIIHHHATKGFKAMNKSDRLLERVLINQTGNPPSWQCLLLRAELTPFVIEAMSALCQQLILTDLIINGSNADKASLWPMPVNGV